jgi:hypothetical protein
MRSMARSWTALANQMDRLDEREPVNAALGAGAVVGRTPMVRTGTPRWSKGDSNLYGAFPVK